MILPPGTILQHMYLKERLKRKNPGRFVEVGVGQGVLSRLLLKLGWEGKGYDLNPEALEKARRLNRDAVDAGRYQLRHADWLRASDQEPVDLIISCMVLEHLNETDERRYVSACQARLKDNGSAIVLVPASPRHWGIEDDIAGHFRRYTRDSLTGLFESHGFQCRDIAGLTYPVSNILLPVSNWLVARAESHQRNLSMRERTEQSGNRDVAGKTTFPPLLGLVLNEGALTPWHGLQKVNRNNPNALVLFAEFEKSIR